MHTSFVCIVPSAICSHSQPEQIIELRNAQNGIVWSITGWCQQLTLSLVGVLINTLVHQQCNFQHASSVISYEISAKKGFGRVDHFLSSKQ